VLHKHKYVHIISADSPHSFQSKSTHEAHVVLSITFSSFCMKPQITNYKFTPEGFTICTYTKEAWQMRSAFETGGTKKEAGPMVRKGQWERGQSRPGSLGKRNFPVNVYVLYPAEKIHEANCLL